MKRKLKRWLRWRLGPWVTPAATPLTEKELVSRLAAAPEQPLWQAVLAVVDAEILETMDSAVSETLPEAAVRHRLGGVDALQRLKDRLAEYEERARKGD